MTPSTHANLDVLEFYKQLPFNYRGDVKQHSQAILERNAVEAYPVLPPILKPSCRVLDVGCGTGWMANNIAYHYQCCVMGIDFNSVAISRAREIAAALSSGATALSLEFVETDLFQFLPDQPFDVVISLGVLHHTNDCSEGLRHLCRSCVKPGGHMFIGLYHKYGRKPFLDHFSSMMARGASEAEMFKEYRMLHSVITDETHADSWFRDQVLHPHETQHTLEEVVPLLREEGMELLSTSINRFQPFDSVESLFKLEKTYEEYGKEMLAKKKFFPGFFVFLARKEPSA